MSKTMAKIWNNKLYMKTLFADLVSNFGDIVYYVALMNYITLIPEKELAISIISIVTPLPSLFSFVTGYYADKTKQKVRNILITLFFRTTLYIVLAFAMGFSPALWIVLLAIMIDFISDVSGEYENGMYLKIVKNIISDEDRESFMAFAGSLFNSLYIVFKALGAVLIAVMSFQSLAFLNAATFLFSAIVLLSIKTSVLEAIGEKKAEKSLDSKEDCQSEQNVETTVENKKFNVKEIYSEQKQAFQFIFSMDEMKLCANVWQVENALSAMIMSLVVLMLGNGDSILIISVAATIALVQISDALGSLTGGYLNIIFFKNVRLTTFLKVDVIVFLAMFIALYYRQIYIVLACNVILSISTVSTNAKLFSFLTNNYDEDKLGSIYGGIESFFCIGSIISGIIFSVLVLTVSINTIVLIAIGICVAQLLYVFLNKEKKKQEV